MDATAHYRNLVTLGRTEFLASSAPAALVRRKLFPTGTQPRAATLTLDEDVIETSTAVPTLDAPSSLLDARDVEIYPLVKKPGASFQDRITIGRTANNDIVIADTSISRLHAYVKRDGAGWIVGDAGSKNGTWLAGDAIAARKERPLTPRTTLRLGEVDLQFFHAADLYAALGGAG